MTPVSELRARDIGFVDRMHRMRALGLALGALPIGSVLHAHDAGIWTWALLVFNALVWPHLCWALARRSRDPREAEFRNLMIDSIAGGAWIAAMQFNLLPSALLVVMLSIDKIAVAGWRFLARTALAQAIACLVVWALLGFALDVRTTMDNVVASLPFLFVYPLAVTAMSHALVTGARRQNRLLERLNRTDALTGLHNRGSWEEIVASELARFLRARRPAVVMLIDVDNFKAVNDRYGHAAGDLVLRRLGDILRTTLREIDASCRYGGDEFAALFTETDLRGARAVAERVRATFIEKRGAEAAREGCTLSIGLAEADRLLTTAEDWVRRADAAMYRAKAGGRDRVDAG